MNRKFWVRVVFWVLSIVICLVVFMFFVIVFSFSDFVIVRMVLIMMCECGFVVMFCMKFILILKMLNGMCVR